MKKTLKVVAITLAVQLVLGTGYWGYVLSTPDDALATVQVSRTWISELRTEQARQRGEKQQMQEQLGRMAAVCELNERYGRKGM